MKHKSPKQLRKRKQNPYCFSDISDFQIASVGVGPSRADRLPPFDEYNPNRIHVARRRQARKDHYSFPRGWTWTIDEKEQTTGTSWSIDEGVTADGGK